VPGALAEPHFYLRMDVVRAEKGHRIKGRRINYRYVAYAAAGLIVIALVTLGLSRLKPASLSVDRSTLLIDTVKRGSMLRQVRGPGTLVPEGTQLIPAPADGRVERILVQPGAEAGAGMVIVELSNPELLQAAVDVSFQLKAAEADLASLRVKLEGDRMSQQSVVATAQAEYSQAKLQSDTDEALARDGLIPSLSVKLSKSKTAEVAERLKVEQQRLAMSSSSVRAQVAAQESRIEQFRALAKLKQQQAEALQVRAGIGGVVQQVFVEVGQQVTPGVNLVKLADPQSLKAELKISETQAKDIQLGQKVAIDTRNGIVPGHVIRIDPSVQQGTVTVDVALEGGLPQGARPDLSVDGTIEFEKLNDVLYVGRPAFGQEQSTVSMFRVESGGDAAVRTQVKLGRSSVSVVEILEGLKEGDQVILSDISAWDGQDRISLK
jgi:HlyD family secretion protein